MRTMVSGRPFKWWIPVNGSSIVWTKQCVSRCHDTGMPWSTCTRFRCRRRRRRAFRRFRVAHPEPHDRKMMTTTTTTTTTTTRPILRLIGCGTKNWSFWEEMDWTRLNPWPCRMHRHNGFNGSCCTNYYPTSHSHNHFVRPAQSQQEGTTMNPPRMRHKLDWTATTRPSILSENDASLLETTTLTTTRRRTRTMGSNGTRATRSYSDDTSRALFWGERIRRIACCPIVRIGPNQGGGRRERPSHATESNPQQEMKSHNHHHQSHDSRHHSHDHPHSLDYASQGHDHVHNDDIGSCHSTMMYSRGYFAPIVMASMKHQQ